ncbi:hypothetical protein [Pedobacter ginsengisoli]|uniref:hypothetical protein n=1 Tax=Pedobacter ginsengisoli TaxID=363852 RepID=UPI0025514BFC|nr:hypothetical protein [Pedobacter ginsengisoli]
MRLIKYFSRQPYFLAGLLLMASCGDAGSDKTAEVKPAVSSTGTPAGPFPFYKNIEIRPGISFEVVSWGKGVDSIGGYLILRTDSAKNSFKSLSNEREGIITDAWNMDMDNDGDPEIYIEMLSKKNVSDLNVYEYSGGSFNKITFPGLSSSLKKNYGGNDKYTIKNGDLFRSFPLVNPKDSTQKAGELKTVQYRLSGNSFSTSEVKPDSETKE